MSPIAWATNHILSAALEVEIPPMLPLTYPSPAIFMTRKLLAFGRKVKIHKEGKKKKNHH